MLDYPILSSNQINLSLSYNEMDLAPRRTPLVTVSSLESLNAREIAERAISAWKFAKTSVDPAKVAVFVIHELPLTASVTNLWLRNGTVRTRISNQNLS